MPVVRITATGACVPDPCNATAKQPPRDEVEWERAGGGDFTVTFHGRTPFVGGKKVFTQDDPSGEISEGAGPPPEKNKERYEYTVAIPGAGANDPFIDVRSG